MPIYQAVLIGDGISLVTPSADGAAGTVMVTDGSLVLSFATGIFFIGGSIGVNNSTPPSKVTVRASSAIAAAVADGGNTGADDCTSGGTFNGATTVNYKIEIDGGDPANPNTFKWSDNNGATWDVATVAITGATQTLNNGVTITFGATTGHDTGDFWTFAATVVNPFLVEDESGNDLVTVLNNGRVGIGTVGPDQILTIRGDNSRINVRDTGGTEGFTFGILGGGAGFLNVRDAAGNIKTLFRGDGGPNYIIGGNVGIGVADPDAKLEVSGNVHLSSDGDKVVLGVAGETDYTIEWDGDDAVHTITAGDFVFTGGSFGVTGTGSVVARIETTDTGTARLYLKRLGGEFSTRITGNNYYVIRDEGNSLDKLTLKPGASGDVYYTNIGNFGIGEPDPQDKLEVTGRLLVKDKVCFTQDDRNEYIDSLNDGYMDYGATTAHRFDNDIVLPKTSGNGIKVDQAAPTFPWHDLTGAVVVKATGAGRPSFITYKGNIEEYQFATNDKAEFTYHIPHDYVPGSDIHLHVHWSHISEAVTGGTITFGYELTYAKGHNQAPFGANKTRTIPATASATQYQHIVSEIQISAASPSESQIDSDDLEPDGLLLIELFLDANNMTGATPDPFVHEMDIHYQSTNIGTKEKAPDFYA